MRFSIVIPTYGRRATVLRTVAALERQEHGDFEVVVVDDGSADGSAEALRALEVSFPLLVVAQDNRGAAEARNAGAAAAGGDILLFLDDDMEADPSLLTEHERSHRDGADLVLGDVPLHPDSPRNLLTRGVGSWARSRRDRLAAAPTDVPLEDLLTGQMSIARGRFEELGGFDTSFTRDGSFGGEDVDFGYRALKAGCRIVFNPAAVSHQYFDVDPADYLRREYDAGRAAQELALKHRERAERVGGRLRLQTRRSRWLLWPFVVAPRAVSRPLVVAVARLVRSGFEHDRLGTTFQAVRAMEHVRGARAAQKALSCGDAAVLAYHSIADLSYEGVLRKYGVPTARFAEQLDALARHGWTFVTLDQLLGALDGASALPRRSVLLTFDDAYADLLDAGLPLLAERDIPAVVFAVAGRVGGTNDWDRALGAGVLSLLDADGLRAVAAGGVEVGSHSCSHRPLSRVPADELSGEIEGSTDRLEALGLPRPRVLSYPHGDWSPEVAAQAQRAGYAAAFTVEPGTVHRGADRYALPRIEVFASDTPWRLRLKLATARLPSRWRKRALELLGAQV